MAAREDFAKRNIQFTYLNVQKDRQAMAGMLAATKGARQVPVIVEDGKVSVGFGGT